MNLQQNLKEFQGQLLIPIRKDFFSVGTARLNIDSMFVILTFTKEAVIFPEHEIPKDSILPFLPSGSCLQNILEKFIKNDERLLKSCILNRVGYNRITK